MKRDTTALLLVSILLQGCISQPKNNLEFSELADLQSLAGTYRNKGEPSGELSKILWGRETLLNGIPHSEIQLVRVSEASNGVVVSAITNDCIAYERKYIAGQDFKISDGRIVLRGSFGVMHPSAGIGPVYEKIELGLDTKGDAKYRTTGAAAMLAFLVLPIAGYERRDIRFVRVEQNKVFDWCALSR